VCQAAKGELVLGLSGRSFYQPPAGKTIVGSVSARRPSPPGGLLAGGGLNSGAASTSLKNRATASIKYLLSTIITVQASFRLGHDFRRVVGVVVMMSVVVAPYQPKQAC